MEMFCGRRTWHGGGDEVQHGGDTFPVQPLRALHGQHDAGLGFGPLAREGLAARQHEVDARLPHAGQRADGARDLALQRAQAVHVLLEGRGGEGLAPVEDLVADRAAGGQAVACQQQPHARHLCLRHQHLRAARGEAMRDARALQRRDHLPRVARVEVAVEQGHRRLRRTQREEGEQPEHGHADARQRRQPHRAHRTQLGDHPAHAPPSRAQARSLLPRIPLPASRREGTGRVARATLAGQNLPDAGCGPVKADRSAPNRHAGPRRLSTIAP
jgi:hypothetical protein